MDDRYPIPELEHLDHDDAWQLGSMLLEHCRAAGHPATIDVSIGEQRVFHAALPGSAAMNDGFVDRKANVVRYFDRSSLDVYERYAEDNPRFADAFDAPMSAYAPGEGAVPLRIRGAQVGVLSMSGIEPTGDHEVVVAVLGAFADAQRGAASTGPIRHTVCFSLVHAEGSDAEAGFLADAHATLTAIPGLSGFAISRQFGSQSDLRFQFAMTFADQEAYSAYNAHPAHQEFVATRWASEVSAFQELDFLPYP